MSDLLAEVDEAMRRERMEKIWKEYGNYIIAALLVLVLGTGVVSGYKAWNTGVKAAQTQQLAAMLEDPSFPANIDAAKLGLRPGLRGIVLLSAAAAQMEAGRTEEALGLYTIAAADRKIPDELRHLAVLMRVRLLAAQPENTEDLQKLLKEVWNSGSSPWRYHAYVESAALYARGDTDLALAREQLAPVAEARDAPESLIGRARALDHVYALRQKNSSGESKADQRS